MMPTEISLLSMFTKHRKNKMEVNGMKTVFPKLKWIGKRAISFLLSVLLIFQIMDFSVISIGATEESGNLP